jgi:uncharacterized FAD-dependent dehydrogenase
MIRVFDIVLSLDEGEELLPRRITDLLGISPDAIISLRVVRRSLDARRNRPPRFVYVVDVCLVDEKGVLEKAGEGLKIRPVEEETERERSLRKPLPDKRPIVVGSGPAGLFAALTLALKGIPVLLLERGRPVQERVTDTASFWREGILNRESNVHFGEGGAGTFSDGKLTTRVKNRKTEWVKKTFADLGAPSEILTDARPHIGTDRLRQVVVQLRKRLLELCCEIRFNARVTDVIVHKDSIVGIVVNGREEIRTDHLILAIGQSAVETYEKIHERGIRLAAKPFAMGLRVEHPQELINRIQYGKWWPHGNLPPADYFLTAKIPGMDRAVYTFCMCPGGEVIGCSSAEGEVVTNGMSLYLRESPFANSAVVVNVRVEDFAGESPLSGMAFRRKWEEQAFLFGGGNYRAPAQRLTDFVAEKKSRDIGPTSFRPGVTLVPLRNVLPPFVCEALRMGLTIFDRKMPGFLTSEASLVGVETRTSSPVRIVRGEDGQSVTVSGLYPCGEGSGYAGGIMSSALDGIRAAEHALRTLGE